MSIICYAGEVERSVLRLITPRVHILVCTNLRQPDDPLGCSCAATGSISVYNSFRTAVMKKGRQGDIWVTRTGCMVHCRTGPTVVVYPAGDWYSQVTEEQVEQILNRYLS